MAENDPWLNWSWLKIGPFTPTQEERVAADRRLEEIKTQEASDQKQRFDEKRRIRGSNANIAAQEFEEERRRNISQQLEAERKAAAPYPTQWEMWSLPNKIGSEFSKEGREAKQKALEDYRRRSGIGGGEDVPFSPISGAPQELTQAPQQGPQLPPGWTPPGQAPAPEVPAEPAAVDPRTQMIEDIKRQRELIDAIYPSRQFDQTGEAALAADEDKDIERTKHLAELAFFSGIAKAGGGPWEQVGAGLAGAGQVYASGFNRYQNALERRANRAQGISDQRYTDEATRSTAAIKLYSDEKELEKEALKTARQEQKDRRKEIMEYFDTTKPELGDYPDPDRQRQFDEWKRNLEVSLAQGEIVKMNSRK